MLIFSRLQFIYVIQLFLIFSVAWAVDIVSFLDGANKDGKGIASDKYAYVNIIT